MFLIVEKPKPVVESCLPGKNLETRFRVVRKSADGPGVFEIGCY